MKHQCVLLITGITTAFFLAGCATDQGREYSMAEKSPTYIVGTTMDVIDIGSGFEGYY